MAKYGKDVLERVSGGLKKLPPIVEDFTTAQLIAKLQPEIQDAQQRGYSVQQIVDLLNDNGVKVTVATFKSYLSKNNASQSQTTQGETK